MHIPEHIDRYQLLQLKDRYQNTFVIDFANLNS